MASATYLQKTRLAGFRRAFPLRQPFETDFDMILIANGNGLVARVMRSAAITSFGYIAGQGLRLASNLLLTRILFPEAFGMMALAQTFIIGLVMISDMGTTPSILHHPKGDDPRFLNTAYTLKVLRGGILWGGAALCAWPLAQLYDQPMLAYLIPFIGISLIFHGLEPTRVDTAARHMRLGRLTVIDLAVQVISLIFLTILAWSYPSVWALAIGGLFNSALRLGALMMFLPGHKNRFEWDQAYAKDLMKFGFWLFLSSAFSFLGQQGDKAVLGKFLTLQQLGIYNMAYFLAAFPLLLGYAMTGRFLISIYRERPPAASRANFAQLRKMRFALTGGIMAMTLIIAMAGPWLVSVMYDDRYHQAGSILVLIAVAQLPTIICMSYDLSALAAGDSRNFFWLSAWRNTCTILGLFIGIHIAGLAGAIAGISLAVILAYPPLVILARKHGAWDPLHDIVFALLATTFGSYILLKAWPLLTPFMQAGW